MYKTVSEAEFISTIKSLDERLEKIKLSGKKMYRNIKLANTIVKSLFYMQAV